MDSPTVCMGKCVSLVDSSRHLAFGMNSLEIQLRLADPTDASLIHDVALATWEPTYRNIISQEQIAIMFEDLLSLPAIQRQIVNHEGVYVLALVEGNTQGFAYFNASDRDSAIYKLHRLYVRTGHQHVGIGGALLRYVEGAVVEAGGQELRLNVNRYNTAQEFYRKQGYEVIDTVDIPYKHFWLNDFVMKKALR